MRTFFHLGFAVALTTLLAACGGGAAEAPAPDTARPVASETESAVPAPRP